MTFPDTVSGLTLAGTLFMPESFDESIATPAILVGEPLASVKEQTQSIYAARLASLGYVTMVFDYSTYGESEGEPRRLENPTVKDTDIKSAITYLSGLPYVDADKIGIGICGSGGQFAYAASTDSRIKALAAVVPYGIGMNLMAESLTDEQREAFIL